MMNSTTKVASPCMQSLIVAPICLKALAKLKNDFDFQIADKFS